MRICLFKLGCYLGEMFYLTELADWLRANNRSRFLFTGPPLRLPGVYRRLAGHSRRHGVGWPAHALMRRLQRSLLACE